MRMIAESNMTEVVTLLKSMAPEKRKKILGEFKTEEENKILNEILEQIRLGMPEMGEIDKMRDKIENYSQAPSKI